MDSIMSSAILRIEEDCNQFSCKSKICLFCVGIIGENVRQFNYSGAGSKEEEESGQFDDSNQEISESIFIQGISVLCDTLHVDQRFGRKEEWSLFGIDDFVGLVCCKNCGVLLRKLVLLHQLIIETEASLKQNVQKIKDCIIQSEAEKDGDLEYSINACVQFRKEILKNISGKCQQKNKAEETVQTSSSRKPRRTKRASLRQSNRILKSSPYVKLERLDLSSSVKSRTRQNVNAGLNVKADCDIKHILDASLFDGDEHIDDRTNEDDAWSPPVPISEEENADTDDGDVDGDYKPTRTRSRRGPAGKPGRRGPPRKSQAGRLPTVAPKKRERPPKVDINVSDEDYQPGSASEGDKNDDMEEKFDDTNLQKVIPSTEKAKRVHKGKKIGGRYYKVEYEGDNLKPIYVLDGVQGIFMVCHVKFQRVLNTLVCQHPDCNYMTPITGYFTDQVALRCLRFHVRHRHRSNFKPGDDPNTRQYYCHNCDTHLNSREALAEHRRSLHADQELPPVLCDVCGFIKFHNSIAKHTMTHKNAEEKLLALKKRATRKGRCNDISMPSQFPCDECGKTFKNHTELSTHKASHIPLEIRRQIICEVCGDKFVSAWSLSNHRSRVHLKDKPMNLACHYCSKRFYSKEKSKYEAHIRSHTGEKPFQCTECGKSFHCKWNLTIHERRHNDVGGVTCEFCSNVYKTERYLKRHHAKHHPERVQKPDRLVTAKYINLVHKKEYFGPKLMYPCEPCSHVYQYKSMLISHLKRMHDIEYKNNDDYPWQWTFEDQELGSGGNFQPSFRGRHKKRKSEQE